MADRRRYRDRRLRLARGASLEAPAFRRGDPPCVPRWWREFEIVYRRRRSVYRIKIENPLGVSRGVVNVELDGIAQTEEAITLVDDEKTHNVRIVMGEVPKAEESSQPTQKAQA